MGTFRSHFLDNRVLNPGVVPREADRRSDNTPQIGIAPNYVLRTVSVDWSECAIHSTLIGKYGLIVFDGKKLKQPMRLSIHLTGFVVPFVSGSSLELRSRKRKAVDMNNQHAEIISTPDLSEKSWPPSVSSLYGDDHGIEPSATGSSSPGVASSYNLEVFTPERRSRHGGRLQLGNVKKLKTSSGGASGDESDFFTPERPSQERKAGDPVPGPGSLFSGRSSLGMAAPFSPLPPSAFDTLNKSDRTRRYEKRAEGPSPLFSSPMKDPVRPKPKTTPKPR